jgi:hypothetical protein
MTIIFNTTSNNQILTIHANPGSPNAILINKGTGNIFFHQAIKTKWTVNGVDTYSGPGPTTLDEGAVVAAGESIVLSTLANTYIHSGGANILSTIDWTPLA